MEFEEIQNQSVGAVPTTKKLMNLLNFPFEKSGILILSAFFFNVLESHFHEEIVEKAKIKF